MDSKFKEIINKTRFTGLSTPFFGVAWEYNEKHIDTLRELDQLRSKLSYFVFEYEYYYEQLSLKQLSDFEFEQEILVQYRDKVIKFYKELGEVLLGSLYFALLHPDNRRDIIEIFDRVTLLWAFINANEDNVYVVEYEEIRDMINDLIVLFKKINKLTESGENKITNYI